MAGSTKSGADLLQHHCAICHLTTRTRCIHLGHVVRCTVHPEVLHMHYERCVKCKGAAKRAEEKAREEKRAQDEKKAEEAKKAQDEKRAQGGKKGTQTAAQKAAWKPGRKK
ncbi:unnamed protein product [Penicillium bialowiezense]